ncbi:MAG: hypothetical protein PHF25_03805 [Candidatus Margulisbacteria bacterium]|nr:hypothetical protein [Candidatus Margulisiibacteriota bacterium]
MNIINDIDKQKTKNSYETLPSLKKTANYLFGLKKYTAALQHYKRIIKLWPTEIPEVLLQFERKYPEIEKDTELGLALAELYGLENNPAEAVFIYEELLLSDPLNLDIYKELINTLKKQNKFAEIISYIEKPYSIGVHDEEISHSLALAYLECNNVAKAIHIYEKLVEVNGEKENYLRTLADLYFRNGNPLKAAENAEKRININKNSHNDVIFFIEKCRDILAEPESLNLRLIDLYIQHVYYSKALELLQIKMNEEFEDKKVYIEDKLDVILNSSPNLQDALVLRAKLYLLTSRFSESADDYQAIISNSFYEDKAVNGLKDIIAVFPNQVSALQYLADYYHAKGDTFEELQYMKKLMNADITKSIMVLKQCQELIENNPKNYYAKLTMAEAYLKNENFHKSILIANELLEKGEDKEDAYRLLLLSHAGNRDFVSLRETYEKAKKTCSNKEGLYEMYSEIYPLELSLRKDFFRNRSKNDQDIASQLDYIKSMIENKQYSDALIKIQELSKSNNNYKLFYYQALSFIGLNNYYSAIGSLKKSLSNIFVETSPEYLIVSEKQAEVYELIGSIDSALEKYQKILEIDFQKENTKKREELLKNCPCLEVAGKSLVVVAKDLNLKEVTVIFNRNILKNKQKEHFESSMGVVSNNEAVEDILKGKIASASDRLKVAEQMDSSHKNILNNKAVLSLLEKNYQEASKIFERILKSRKSASTAAYYHMGFILTYHLKKYDEAKSLIKKLIDLDEDFYEAYLLLGDVYYFQGKIEKATEYWTIYLRNGLLRELSAQRLLDVNYLI